MMQQGDIGESSSSQYYSNSSEPNPAVIQLAAMGFSGEKASLALERCGSDSSLGTLVDWILEGAVQSPVAERDGVASQDLLLSAPVLVHKLQQLARCGPETAKRAVELFGDDPAYAQLDDKMHVMLDWVAAADYSISGAAGNESDAYDRSTRKPDEDVGYESRRLWAADVENGQQELLESQQYHRIRLEFEFDDEFQLEQMDFESPVKEKKVSINQPFPRRQMTGYGVPGFPPIFRVLDRAAAGPPFFYLENVSCMPRGEWIAISRHLFGIEPEFTDSKYFTACTRPRGYIHNLPIEGRTEITPKAPKTVKELLPAAYEKYWPAWDPRKVLNCILTMRATQTVFRQVDELLELWSDRSKPPSAYVQTEVLKLARRWNLVWINPGRLAPLTINEVEQLMGYEKDHTRILFHIVDQSKCLGNSFQVHTVGYHLSVLKPLYPRGLRVLALFAGIGGAEVALHKAGVRLDVVVSVETDEKCRRVIANWWRATNQTGTLILKYTDVKHLDRENLGKLLERIGGFDLIVGGSPCKNLSGLNRVNRDGLAGASSILFFEFPRIVAQVKEFMARRRKTL